MAHWVLGALLRGGVSMGGPSDGYVFVFCFSFYFGEIFKYVWPIGGPPGPFQENLDKFRPSEFGYYDLIYG